jgi:predicted PurR-regulated permease PerM
MMGVDVRAARVAWTVFLLALAIWLVYAARETILLFIIALFFAYMLSPVVEWIHQRTPKRVSKTWSLAAVYVSLIAVLVLIGMQLGPRITEQATALSQKAPDLLRNPQIAPPAFIPVAFHEYWAHMIAGIRDKISAGSNEVLPLLRTAGTRIAELASSILLVVLVPILAFFFLKDGHDIYRTMVHYLRGAPSCSIIVQILDDLHFVLAKYMRALILLSVAAFIAYLLFFSITGVPYGALLAAIAAPLEFIPVLGPAVASITIVVVCAISQYPHIFWVIAFLVLYRLFQDYVLSPYLMSEGVELHPLLVIFGVLAGERIGGVGGMFLSVPVLAILRVIFMRLRGEEPLEQ